MKEELKYKEMINMRKAPDLTLDNIRRMEDMSWFAYAKIFDDLIIVSQRETCCYVWNTNQGIVIFDGIWPDKRVYEAIIEAIGEAGWENKEITAFFMTHGHIDHVGCGKWLTENHNVTTYLSEQDDILRLDTPSEEGRSDCWKEFKVSRYIADGDKISFGDKQVQIVATPGHTAGCMSFIFPVTEGGEKHIAGIFGGATAPWNDPEGKLIQLKSVEKFSRIAKECHMDVALTNHTVFDNGLERIAYSRKRMIHLPNIYILGEDGAQNFCSVFRKTAE